MSSLAFFLTVQAQAFSSASCTCLFNWPASSGRCCVNSALRTSASVSGKSLCGGGFCDIQLVLSPAHRFGTGLEVRLDRSAPRSVMLELALGECDGRRLRRTSHQSCKAT